MQLHHLQVLKKLGAGTYSEEMSKLMYRYTEGTVCGGKGTHAYKIEHKHQRAMPLTLRTMLHDILGSTKERFASPLDVTPCSGEFWSAHKQDQVFGAYWDTDKTRWTGASTACPDFTEQQAEKAVLWALNSAMHTQKPTLTLLLLPTFAHGSQTQNYMRVIRDNPAFCRHLATLPSGLVHLEASPLAKPSPRQRLKWNTN